MHSILGRPAVIADTHFVRVAKRLGLTDTDDRNKSAKEIRERFPEAMWSRLSMALNLHGRVVCHAKPDFRGLNLIILDEVPSVSASAMPFIFIVSSGNV